MVWWEEHFCPRAELSTVVVPVADGATQPSPCGAPGLRCVVDCVEGGERNVKSYVQNISMSIAGWNHSTWGYLGLSEIYYDMNVTCSLLLSRTWVLGHLQGHAGPRFYFCLGLGGGCCYRPRVPRAGGAGRAPASTCLLKSAAN